MSCLLFAVTIVWKTLRLLFFMLVFERYLVIKICDVRF